MHLDRSTAFAVRQLEKLKRNQDTREYSYRKTFLLIELDDGEYRASRVAGVIRVHISL